MQKKHNLTIDDIARDLGVSKTTVSRAISGKGRISTATRQRVQAYIAETNYRPSAAAKGLAESKTYNIALVLPRSLFKLDMPFIRKSMTAICEEAFLQDYNILLCLSTDDNPASLLRTLDNRKVDGVILSRTIEHDSLVDVLNERGIPFATMGSLPPDGKGKATVEADHDQVGGCKAFTTAFLRDHSGKVGVLGNDMNYMVNQSRYAGFQQGCQTLGLKSSDVLFRHGLGTALDCSHAVDELLEKGVSRFIAMDEEVCLNILMHLRERDISIPEQVQVGSLYDSKQLSLWSESIPALSFDAAELGRVTCRELLHFLRDEEFNPNPTLGYRILMR